VLDSFALLGIKMGKFSGKGRQQWLAVDHGGLNTSGKINQRQTTCFLAGAERSSPALQKGGALPTAAPFGSFHPDAYPGRFQRKNHVKKW
jgi:hypothetical protein